MNPGYFANRTGLSGPTKLKSGEQTLSYPINAGNAMQAVKIRFIRMKILPKLFLSGLTVILFSLSTYAQGEKELVTRCFRSGDPALLKEYFENTLQINILDEESEATREEAVEILREFFRQNPPKDFNIKFSSDKENSKFIIGSLRTDKTSYRINLFFKKREGKNLIHLLRIEEEN